MFGFGKKRETVDKAEHERIVIETVADAIMQAQKLHNERQDSLKAVIETQARDIRVLDKTAKHFQQQRDAARAEAEANKVDATLWRNAREKRKQGRAAA